MHCSYVFHCYRRFSGLQPSRSLLRRSSRSVLGRYGSAHSGCARRGRACRISFVPLTAPSSLVHRVPAPLLFLFGGLSMYAGAAVAVVLFDELRPSVVAWLRLLAAAAVLVAW